MLLIVHCCKKASFKFSYKKKLDFSDPGRFIGLVKQQLTKDRGTATKLLWDNHIL